MGPHLPRVGAVCFPLMVAPLPNLSKKSDKLGMKNGKNKTKNRAENALVKRAKLLARSGYSTIPVHGNKMPTEPKRPATNWKKYQRAIPSKSEIESVFDNEVTAIGIVCGRVSKLLVIDFDDVLRYQRFCRRLPQYSETYTVKTRRGFHLYFRTEEKVPSHQFDGGDIKGEKSYIIAPPSKIGNFVYRCTKNVSEIELQREDIDRILNYFHVRSAAQFVSTRTTETVKDVNLKRVYADLAAQIGRNNALYRAASMGREAGLERAQVERELLLLHVRTEGGADHRYETVQERSDEGLRTIASAFTSKRVTRAAGESLPNSVRERLLQTQRSTAVCRLLDIFLLEGWESGAYFTLRDAVEIARRYGLNRKSVLQALTGDLCTYDGRHIISRRYVEYLDIKGLKGRKRGRPVELMFRVPSAARLLSLLNVAWSPGDRMKRKDLLSARAYRLALHREYIVRLSPRASLRTLARRVGVNERTIRRYNGALDVRVRACIGRLDLSPQVVRALPKRAWRTEGNATRGFWLEGSDGMRFPAWRHIGRRILKAGDKGARVCLRLASVYSLKQSESLSPVVERIGLRDFARVIGLRAAGRGGLLERLGNAIEALRERAAGRRYEKIQLSYGNVAARIADDKVAETINGFLVAADDGGAEVRRPAKRGIAYRMLKEFGDGNVYLALRSSYKEVMASLARHALLAGDAEESADLLARATA